MFRKFVFLLVFTLAACSSANSTSGDSGIEGQVLIGPMCPVVQVGTECPDQPYQATLTVLSPDGQKVTRFETDKNGLFHIALAPGDYILHPESPNVMPYAPEQTFTIKPGEFTKLMVNYDSGIR